MLRDLLPLCALAAAACLQAEPLPRALQPVAVTAGGPSFSLVVAGQGFTISTRVLWEGSPLATYFESATRLSADVPASRLAGAGPVAIAVTRADQKASDALTLTVNPRLEWTTASALSTAPITRF